ncbi:MAG: hypothetical protein K8R36_25330 [Planctomycetales bacterium]|nr:hypothetical protein [Planctomycetales bacterium]
MDTDSLSAESAFPPPPPLLPPPVPPPVVDFAGPAEVTSSLWRWNDRLALAACGLTLLLLGVISGRVLRPVAPSENGAVESVVAVAHLTSESQPLENATAVVAAESLSGEEVNPPQIAVAPESPKPSTIVEQPAPAFIPAPQSAPAPQPSAQQVTASTPSEETEEANPPAPFSAAPATFPVSIEGKVLTIKPPATTQVCAQEKKFKDRKLNTALTWAESVAEASQQAEDEEKLVFLIHVSGNFEVPGFT